MPITIAQFQESIEEIVNPHTIQKAQCVLALCETLSKPENQAFKYLLANIADEYAEIDAYAHAGYTWDIAEQLAHLSAREETAQHFLQRANTMFERHLDECKRQLSEFYAIFFHAIQVPDQLLDKPKTTTKPSKDILEKSSFTTADWERFIKIVKASLCEFERRTIKNRSQHIDYSLVRHLRIVMAKLNDIFTIKNNQCLRNIPPTQSDIQLLAACTQTLMTTQIAHKQQTDPMLSASQLQTNQPENKRAEIPFSQYLCLLGLLSVPEVTPITLLIPADDDSEPTEMMIPPLLLPTSVANNTHSMWESSSEDPDPPPARSDTPAPENNIPIPPTPLL